MTDGHFFANLITSNHQLYTQAMCTIALCELYGMSHNDEYHDAAQKAVDYCVKIQASGRRVALSARNRRDLSVTGWFSMALQSARMAGIEVPSPIYAKITKFLDSVPATKARVTPISTGDGATLPIDGRRIALPTIPGLEAR